MNTIAIGMTIEQIIERLKVRGLTVSKQTLAEIFTESVLLRKDVTQFTEWREPDW